MKHDFLTLVVIAWWILVLVGCGRQEPNVPAHLVCFYDGSKMVCHEVPASYRGPGNAQNR
jgi:hypothetical protein